MSRYTAEGGGAKVTHEASSGGEVRSNLYRSSSPNGEASESSSEPDNLDEFALQHNEYTGIPLEEALSRNELLNLEVRQLKEQLTILIQSAMPVLEDLSVGGGYEEITEKIRGLIATGLAAEKGGWRTKALEKRDLNESIRSVGDANEELELANDGLTAELKNLREENGRALRKIASLELGLQVEGVLQRKLDDLKGSLQKLTTEKEAVDRELALKEVSLKDSTVISKRCLDENDDLRGEVFGLKNKNAELEQLYKNLECQKKSLQETNYRLTEDSLLKVTELNERIAILTEKLGELKAVKERAGLVTGGADLQSELGNVAASSVHPYQETMYNGNLSEQNRKLQEELNRLRLEIARQKDFLVTDERNRSSLSDLQVKYQELEGVNKELLKKIEALGNLQELNQVLKGEKDKAVAKSKSDEEARVSAENRAVDVEKQLGELRGQNEQLQQEKEGLDQKLVVLTAESAKKDARILALQKEIDDLKRQLSTKKTEIDGVQRAKNDADQQIEDLQAQIALKTAEATQAAEEVVTIKGRIVASEKDTDALRTQLAAAKTGSEENDRLAKELQEARVVNARLAENLSASQRGLGAARDKIEVLTQNLAVSKARIVQLEEENRDLKAQGAELNRLLQEKTQESAAHLDASLRSEASAAALRVQNEELLQAARLRESSRSAGGATEEGGRKDSTLRDYPTYSRGETPPPSKRPRHQLLTPLDEALASATEQLFSRQYLELQATSSADVGSFEGKKRAVGKAFISALAKISKFREINDLAQSTDKGISSLLDNIAVPLENNGNAIPIDRQLNKGLILSLAERNAFLAVVSNMYPGCGRGEVNLLEDVGKLGGGFLVDSRNDRVSKALLGNALIALDDNDGFNQVKIWAGQRQWENPQNRAAKLQRDTLRPQRLVSNSLQVTEVWRMDTKTKIDMIRGLTQITSGRRHS